MVAFFLMEDAKADCSQGQSQSCFFISSEAPDDCQVVTRASGKRDCSSTLAGGGY